MAASGDTAGGSSSGRAQSIDPAQALGRLLADAARTDQPLAAATLVESGLVPANREAAMAAQAASVVSLGKAVAGWKVAIGPGGIALAAPMLELHDAQASDTIGCRVPALKAIEVEFGFRLGHDLPVRTGTPYSREDVLGCIAAIHLGVELISFRLREEAKVDPLLFLADRLGNGGYVIGPQIARAAFETAIGEGARQLRIAVDGAQRYAAGPAHPSGDPLAPLVGYANAQNDVLGGLRAGQIVTTGSLCGVIAAVPPCRLEIDWLRALTVMMTR